MQMYQSIIEQIETTLPYLSPSIIDKESNKRIQELVQQLPPTSFAIFESRLGDESLGVDFSVCLRPIDGKRDSITTYHFTDDDYGAWRRLQQFCCEWAKSSSSLYQNVENVWLEFDTGNVSNAGLPSVFFGLQGTGRRDLSVCLEGLTLLLDETVSEEIENHIKQCFTTLTSMMGSPFPARAGIFQAGVMLARNAKNVRICIAGVPIEQIPAYLTQIGWKGSIFEIQSTLQRYSPSIDEIVLHLEVGNEIAPKIGLEAFVYTNEASIREQRWTNLLNRLVSDNLCTTGKRDAVLDWMGITKKSSFVDLAQVAHASSTHRVRLTTAMIRRINHLKFVFEPNLEPIAKAYLSYEYLQLTPEVTREIKTKLNRLHAMSPISA